MAFSQLQNLYSTQAKVKRSDKVLSVGIELEGLLAYKEQLLRRTLKPGLSIAKEPLLSNGQRVNKNIWPGWGVYETNPDNDGDSSLGEADMDFSDGEEEDANVDQQPGHDKETTATSDSNRTDVDTDERVVLDKWLVKRDFSVRQLTKEQKLERRIDPDQWDTSDIEFVTKTPYVDIAELQSDIRELNCALDSDDLEVLVSNTCGFHVHVGFPDNSAFPLPATKVLMFTLVVFEREISRLHAPHRRASYEDRDSNIYPNLAGWKHPDQDAKHDYDFGHDRLRRSTHQSISDIRKQIFSSHQNLSELEVFEYLKSLFPKGKNHIVNWRNIDGDVQRRSDPQSDGPIFHAPRRPPTIEFRQHEGTFDSVAIGHWVHFCRAIVQFGLDYASDGWLVLPSIQSWTSRIRIEDLLGVLRLPGETRGYYMAKARAIVVQEHDSMWEEAVVGEAAVEWRIVSDT